MSDRHQAYGTSVGTIARSVCWQEHTTQQRGALPGRVARAVVVRRPPKPTAPKERRREQGIDTTIDSLVKIIMLRMPGA